MQYVVFSVSEAREELRDAVLILLDAGAPLRDLLVEDGVLDDVRELLELRGCKSLDAQVSRFLHPNACEHTGDK